MKFTRVFLSVLFVAASALASQVVDVLEVNGVRYTDVKFGPVNQDKVVLFHSHGVTTVPVASLPIEYQQSLGIKPAAAPAPSAAATPVTVPAEPGNVFLPVPQEVTTPRPTTPPVVTSVPPSNPAPANPNAILEAMRAKHTEPVVTRAAYSDWGAYNADRETRVLFEGKLVEKSTLTPLIGFLAKERATITDNGQTRTGATLDLAERKAGTTNVATAMEMRPGLWQRTDERVFLLNYKPTTIAGAMLMVYVVEAAPVDGWRTFKVATEPTFEEWRRLH